MKTIVIAKVAKAVINEVRKYKVSANVDKGTSKMTIIIQKK